MCSFPSISSSSFQFSLVCLALSQLAVKKWRVETNSRLRSVLNLASINLPGGVLVRISHYLLFVVGSKVHLLVIVV